MQFHRIERQLRAVRRVGHRVGTAHAHFGGKLAQHFNHVGIEADKIVPLVAFTEGDRNVVDGQQVFDVGQGAVLDRGDLRGDRVDLDVGVTDALEVIVHVAILAGRSRAFFVKDRVHPFEVGGLFHRMLKVEQPFGKGCAVFGFLKCSTVFSGLIEHGLVGFCVSFEGLVAGRIHVR